MIFGKRFAFYFQKDERRSRILKLVEEMQGEFKSSEFLAKFSLESPEFQIKKFRAFLSENKNRKTLKRIKTLMLQLENAFSKKK